jgi:nicotinamide-nucleotide amidase
VWTLLAFLAQPIAELGQAIDHVAHSPARALAGLVDQPLRHANLGLELALPRLLRVHPGEVEIDPDLVTQLPKVSDPLFHPPPLSLVCHLRLRWNSREEDGPRSRADEVIAGPVRCPTGVMAASPVISTRMNFDQTLLDAARGLIERCKAAGVTIATAESCTGGLLAALLTEIAGSSAVFDRGLVTYSNQAKIELLGVPAGTLAAHGAVSEPVARAMAEGARERAGVTLAIAITGIAGPGGGTPQKPVGLVHFGLSRDGRETRTEDQVFSGDRHAIRLAAVSHALRMLADAL